MLISEWTPETTSKRDWVSSSKVSTSVTPNHLNVLNSNSNLYIIIKYLQAAA